MKATKFLFTLLVLMASYTVAGQERVLEFPELYTDTSIIRSYAGGDSMLICNHAYGTNTFICLRESTTTLNTMAYPEIERVTDMEIEGDVVYFCGRMREANNSLIGFVGYFNLSSYPNANATIYKLPGYDCINKLVVTDLTVSFSTRHHLMMIGTQTSGISSLIDMQVSSPLVFAVYNSSYFEPFLDISQTQNNVIVTSWYLKSSGHVWVFPKSITSGNYFFDGNNIKQAINPSAYTRPCLIAPTTGDEYAVTSWPDYSAPLYVSYFNATTSTQTLHFTTNSYIAKDIKYNPSGNKLDILVRNNGLASDMFFHVPIILYPIGGYYTEISCSNIQEFSALDRRNSYPNRFIATGKTASTNLGMFLYGSNGGSCTARVDNFCSVDKDKWDFTDVHMRFELVYPSMVTLEPIVKNTYVNTKCSSLKEQNQEQ